jgi:hypothetical protein
MPEPHSKRAEVIGAVTAGLIIVLFCLLLLRHDPLLFWNDDYQLSILPVFADVARSWSEGYWPLLSPYSWVCSNLAGEFQYGTFSVFVNAAVVLIWKFPFSFAQQAAALSITHLFVLAAGAFLLARDRRLSLPLSIFVGLVAALNGWIVCWGATDWFGALGAFAWLPWAWWSMERALDRQRTNWRFLWPAPFVYLVVTGGFPYTIVMLALLIAWLTIKALAQTRSLSSVFPIVLGVALGFGLSSPAWLAIFDYVQGSGREFQPASAHWQWIVPPAALPGFILPCWTVNWANFSTHYLPHSATELACGLVPPVALIAGLVGRGRALVKQVGWELGLLAVVLIISMMPSAGMFRWSFRWLPFFHLILALCAAEALQMLPDKIVSPARSPGFIALALVAVTSGAMWTFGTFGKYASPLTWIFLALAIIWVLAEFLLRDSRFRPWTPAVITFASLLATYLCIPPNCGVPRYNLSQELTNPAPLDPSRLYLSIYPPAENTYRIENKPGPVGQIARPGSTSMWGGLHFIDGYSPILPAGVAREFKFAIHGEIDWEVGKYLLTKQAGADGELARLGVDGIVVAVESGLAPEPASEWDLVLSTDEAHVFHRRTGPVPRVRSVSFIDSRPNDQFAAAKISQISDSRNRVEADIAVLDGSRPALLAFSRPFFPGYRTTFNGKEAKVSSYRGLMPLVELPGGAEGRLVLSYRPWWLRWGGGFSICCAVLWMAGLIFANVGTARGRLRSIAPT